MTNKYITVKLDCSKEWITPNRLWGARWWAIFGYNTWTEHEIHFVEPLFDGDKPEFKGEFDGDSIYVSKDGDRYFATISFKDGNSYTFVRWPDNYKELWQKISELFFSYDKPNNTDI